MYGWKRARRADSVDMHLTSYQYHLLGIHAGGSHSTETHTQRHISVYNIYVYIYIYGTPPPMNYPPSFCVVNTVLNQLSRQVRICISQRFCISQRLPNTNHISIECASQLVQVNVSVRSNATLCSSNQKPISLGKTKKHKNHLLGTLRPNSQRMFFGFP